MNNEVQRPTAVSEIDVQRIVAAAIDAERRATDARFVEQEHRRSRVFLNWYDGIRSEDVAMRRSAWLALLWSFIPSSQTFAIAAGGFATLLVTIVGATIAYRANLLFERQNERLDVQNLLSEAQRRSAYFNAEMAIIQPLIQQQIASAAVGTRVELPLDLKNRIVNLSATLRPYRVAEMADAARLGDKASDPEKYNVWEWPLKLLGLSGEDRRIFTFTERQYSPERGQLFYGLYTSKVEIDDILGLNLSNLLLRGVSIEGLNMSITNFDGARFENVTLRGNSFAGTSFNDAEFIDVNFENNFVKNMELNSAVFNRVIFSSDNDWNSVIENSGQKDCEIDNSFLSGANADHIIELSKMCKVKSLTMIEGDIGQAKKLEVSLKERNVVCYRPSDVGLIWIIGQKIRCDEVNTLVELQPTPVVPRIRAMSQRR